jgi:hypothetical protein
MDSKVMYMELSEKYAKLQQTMDDYGQWVRSSADVVLRIVNVAGKSVVDFGCGRGDWLVVARELHAKDILGIDSYAIDGAPLLVPSIYMDITKPVVLDKLYDVAICLEVAEHIDKQYASTLIESLVHAAPVVLFSAAVPGQGGIHHVNEQPPSYWHALFQCHDYECYDFRSHIWDEVRVEPWYRMNCLLYIKKGHSNGELAKYQVDAPMHFIHPEIFAAYAPKNKDIILHWDKAQNAWFPEFI